MLHAKGTVFNDTVERSSGPDDTLHIPVPETLEFGERSTCIDATHDAVPFEQLDGHNEARAASAQWVVIYHSLPPNLFKLSNGRWLPMWVVRSYEKRLLWK
ncbi:hypothetical protein WOLCODRAFT_26871 [Wolfiporia cocos MD-104 SS10]|uniref:Uncharacterized protein n=1 Tax=Wolfiporia cocos (strain MD-104) TaxID=742152 RepID=A0A2H3JSU3_WOLCO|nr:hypothetical protein WOLCODRAFT_26871 [Wolfiporia cocos MD-104 SS10]